MTLYKKKSQTQQKKYYIEFVGQHTAGKTLTICKVVDNKLLAPKVAVYPQKIKRSLFHFTLTLPVLIIQNIKNLLFVNIFLFRYASLSWINYHAVGRHLFKMVLLHPYYCKNYNFDIWLKDDMLHLLPRIKFKKGVDVKCAFQEFFSHFSYLYDCIVYIDLPYDVMNQRFKNRFSTRSSRRRKSRIPVYERAFSQNIILRQVISDQTNTPFLILDGTNDILENANLVTEFIKKHVYKN